MEKLLFSGMVLMGGLLVPIQIALNGLLKNQLGHPMQATFVSYFGGAVGALIVCLITRNTIPDLAKWGSGPWYMWFAGFLGTVFVLANIIAVPKLGAGLTLALTVSAQLIMAVMLDHLGLFGLEKQSLNVGKIIGMLLVVLGAVTIVYGNSISVWLNK